MIRKLLLVGAAVFAPVGLLTFASTTAGASAGPPDPPVNCSVSATVTFAPPGISVNGSITTAKTSITTASNETFGNAGTNCTGSGPNLSIASKNVKCDKHTPGQPSSNPACEPGFRGYDSWNNFATGGTASLQKATKKLSFTINGITYTTKSTSASATGCSGGEVGFKVVGTVKGPKNDKGQTATLTACLGSTTGTGTTAACQANFAKCINGPGTVQTTQLDPATSRVDIH